jgi:hypothetical protein
MYGWRRCGVDTKLHAVLSDELLMRFSDTGSNLRRLVRLPLGIVAICRMGKYCRYLATLLPWRAVVGGTTCSDLEDRSARYSGM